MLFRSKFKLYTKFDACFDIAKDAAKQLSFHPETILLTNLYERVWDKESAAFVQALTASFDLSNDGTVSRKKQQKLRKLSEAAARKMVKQVMSKTSAVFKLVHSRAVNHFARQLTGPVVRANRNRFGKDKKLIAKGANESAAWFAFMQEVNEDHIEKFINAFPSRILLKEVDRLTKLFEINPNARTIDKAELFDRLKRFPQKSRRYWNNVADVYVGRMWHFTGLEMMWEEGVNQYQIISQGDKATCPVCQRLHGHIFSVVTGKKKMDKFLSLDDPDAISKHYKFPRINKLSWRAYRRQLREGT